MLPFKVSFSKTKLLTNSELDVFRKLVESKQLITAEKLIGVIQKHHKKLQGGIYVITQKPGDTVCVPPTWGHVTSMVIFTLTLTVLARTYNISHYVLASSCVFALVLLLGKTQLPFRSSNTVSHSTLRLEHNSTRSACQLLRVRGTINNLSCNRKDLILLRNFILSILPQELPPPPEMAIPWEGETKITREEDKNELFECRKCKIRPFNLVAEIDDPKAEEDEDFAK